jgi:membrane protein YqaA with SNARE-associated domain
MLRNPSLYIWGFTCQRVRKAERPSQSWVQSTTHIQETHKTTATLSRAHQANNKQLQKLHEVLQVLTMPNNSRYLGLVLFILGSWLAIVIDVFTLLDSCFSRNLMTVGGEVVVLLSRWCWLGMCCFVSILVSNHMVVRSSEGLLKCAIGGVHARQT